MDDLTRFALACAGLLAFVALVAFFRPLARLVVAVMLARAFRAIARPCKVLERNR